MKTGGKCIMRRKLKRIAGITLCAGMIITGLPVGSYQENNFIMSSTVYADEMQYSVGNSTYSYVIEDDGTVTLTRYSGTDTDIVIPKSIDGKMVTSIGFLAFSGCSGLTSITIPEGVTSIAVGAFEGCSGLTSISIPEGVTSIGFLAFSECSGLTTIKVDSNNKKYDSRNNCNAIIDKETNTLIAGCKNTIIPEGVTSIGNYAFSRCSGLTSITIPEGVTSIGYRAFYNCSGLTSISIPEGVTSIGYSAFSGCSGLTSINIPNSVTSIGWAAFSGCSGLTSISIPKGVTSIESFAFYDCDDLTIYGTAGSYVETYAKEESIPFVIIQSACNYGDFNNDNKIDSKDILLMKKKLAGYEVADLNKEACDVNGDGKVTSVDAVLLLKYVAGYDVKLGK